MASGTLQAACFRVDGRDCAVDVLSIAEVLRPLPVTSLPGAPAFVEGLIELRGRFLPVIDLRKRFGAANPGPGHGNYIVAPLGGNDVALIVDEVMGVERIPIDQIQKPPAMDQTQVASAFVSGIVQWNNGVLMLLDISKVLSDSEKSQLASVA